MPFLFKRVRIKFAMTIKRNHSENEEIMHNGREMLKIVDDFFPSC